MRILSYLLLFSGLFALSGCKTDPLVGRWLVMDITRDGQSIAGKGFKGSNYVFRKDGIVQSWTTAGDTVEVEYQRRGDSLLYVTPESQEVYLIDSISDYFLKLQLDQDGYSSKVFFRKVE
ncbi:MAG: hypothetical protein AAGN35_10205 [Bacteroidota bacterium]